MKQQVMLDCETTGKKAGCPILSIGVCTITPLGVYQVYYEKISIESCYIAGLTSDQSTLKWWGEQPEEAYKEAFSGTTPLIAALHKLTETLASIGDYEGIWSCGSDFDFPILQAAYNAVGLDAPWAYGKVRDYRTLRQLFPKIKPIVGNKLKHSAIADATYQASHLMLILDEIERMQNGG